MTAACGMNLPGMASVPKSLPKMMLGFVVRRCAVALGHEPSPEEFAAWANACRDGRRTFSLFGRPITAKEARAILRHPARLVSARGAQPHEQVSDDEAVLGSKLTSLRAAAVRLRARRGK
jgi:hypothetical protein